MPANSSKINWKGPGSSNKFTNSMNSKIKTQPLADEYFYSSVTTLKILPRNFNEIVRSWIRLLFLIDVLLSLAVREGMNRHYLFDDGSFSRGRPIPAALGGNVCSAPCYSTAAPVRGCVKTVQRHCKCEKIVAGHWLRGRCRRHRNSGIQHLSPVS